MSIKYGPNRVSYDYFYSLKSLELKLTQNLAGQTAIYGLSSIIGRFLNFLLVPLYTYQFAQAEYGIVTEVYAYVGFFLVIFTYGMETAFFRFYMKQEKNTSVFSTALISLLVSTIVLSALFIPFSGDFASILKFPDQEKIIFWIILIIGFDTMASLPFAKMRADNKPVRFATVKLINIGINIGLNLFFILACPYIYNYLPDSALYQIILPIYDPSLGIEYIFISNLIASAVTFLITSPYLKEVKSGFDKKLWIKMFKYAFPLIAVGMAGIINETLDRIFLKFFLPGSISWVQAQIGIYGACYKLALFMTLFIQAYRYAAEPYFFSIAEKENGKSTYALTMKYFVIIGGAVFLFILLYLDFFKYFIGPEFRSGLKIVPVILMANLFLGIYYNLSIWYKMTDQTRLGSYVAIGGALITIVGNILLIPVLGYMGSAWATLICYVAMVIISYFLGKKYFPVKYDLVKISVFILLPFILWIASGLILDISPNMSSTLKFIVNTLLLSIYIITVYRLEKEQISKWFNKQVES